MMSVVTSLKSASASLEHHDAKWRWKQIVRAVACFSSLIALGIFAWGMTKHFIGWYPVIPVSPRATYSHAGGRHRSHLTLMQFTLAIVYAFVTIPLTLWRGRPIHPGWNVAADLVLWLAMGLAVILVTPFLAMYSIADSYDPEYYAYATSNIAGTVPVYRPAGTHPSNTAHIEIGAVSFGAVAMYVPIALSNATPSERRGCCCIFIHPDMAVANTVNDRILHFILFIAACVDTHRHRRRDHYGYNAQNDPSYNAGLEGGGYLHTAGIANNKSDFYGPPAYAHTHDPRQDLRRFQATHGNNALPAYPELQSPTQLTEMARHEMATERGGEDVRYEMSGTRSKSPPRNLLREGKGKGKVEK